MKSLIVTCKYLLAAGIVFVSQSLFAGVDGSDADYLKNYNVEWTTPSEDAWGSMPLSGKYGAGANVWVQDGALWMYLAHNYAYDEEGHLLKLGALRITPDNQALNDLESFSQRLDILTGSIHIQARSKKGTDFQARLWFSDENLIVECKSAQSSKLDVSFASWRDVTRDTVYIDMGNRINILRADHVSMETGAISWYHNNAEYPSRIAEEIGKQNIDPKSICNPAENNVFGGTIVCSSGLFPVSQNVKVNWQSWTGASWNASTASATKHTLVVALRAGNYQKPSGWASEARPLLGKAALKKAWKMNVDRWNEFWNRSHIYVNPGAEPSDSAWVVGRNYQLFRYMLATNQGGKLPLLFNGGIFTTDNLNHIAGNNNDEITRGRVDPSTPDLRHWMFCGFMAQNQRWIGWPTILSGDADLLEPSTVFYRMHAASAASRARCMGAQGMVYPEAIQVWGLTWWPTATGQCGAAHLKHAFAMMLENAWMTLHGHTTLGTDISKDIAWIKGVVKFYDSYYRSRTREFCESELVQGGRLNIFPANSIELLVGAQNPTEVVAGLFRISDALTKLPDSLVTADEKKYFANVLKTLPEIAKGTVDGKEVILPAQSYMKEYNLWELPEFYVAWPYRQYSVCHPGTTQILQNTWDLLPQHRREKVYRDYSWMPVVVNMAAIGNTAEAARRVTDKLGNFNAQSRFPAFFGPGHDWVPDHNWGGSGMVGLQEMLMAADPYGDGKIFLLPTWPVQWDVDFKLHAPQNTTVEVEVKKGKVVKLNVFPESRRKDIILNSNFIINDK